MSKCRPGTGTCTQTDKNDIFLGQLFDWSAAHRNHKFKCKSMEICLCKD